MKSIINSPYCLWLLLALPSIPMIISMSSGGGAEPLLHPTGEFAARFMIVAINKDVTTMKQHQKAWQEKSESAIKEALELLDTGGTYTQLSWNQKDQWV